MCRIRNPLKGIAKEVLLRQVEDFAAQRDLVEYLPTLKQGALLAQDPTVFDLSDLLDANARQALQDEVTHKWLQPKALYMTIALCSIGAAVQ